MSFDTPTLEIQGEGETISKQQAEVKMLEISDIQKHINKISENKDPEIRDRLENSGLQSEVLQFISDAANNSLSEYSSEYSANKFDTDGENGLDSFEFKNFSDALSGAIEQIVILDGIGAFNDIQEDSAYSGWYSPDKKLAEYADFQELFLGDDEGSSFSEEALNALGVSDEELHNMSEKPFDMTSSESWGEMGILLMKELGEGVEDILRFMGNIPAGTILLPRYLSYRVDINSADPVQATEGEIKIKELVADNPSLGLLDLIGEKGIDMIKQLGSMLVSGKQGDIAMTLVTIAGLLAGGAGAVKLGARATNMSRVERVAGNIQKGAARVDDLVGGAGMGHMTGQFSNNSPISTSIGEGNQVLPSGGENIHMKNTDESTIPVRYGQRWDNPEMEYNSLLGMSGISDKIAKPLGIQRDSNGRMTGYALEKINNPYTGNITSLPLEMKQQIKNEFQKLHQNGYAHGDINTQNILLYYPDFPDISAIDFKIIDPVGFPQNFENLNQAKIDDMNQLDKILGNDTITPTTSKIFSSGDVVNVKWDNGTSYQGHIIGNDSNTPGNFLVNFSDGKQYSIHPDNINTVSFQPVEGTQVNNDVWDIPSENLSPMNAQAVSNLFTNISDQPIYRELNTLITNADITTGDGRQALKDNLLGTLKRDVDNLGARVENNTAWIESSKSTLGDLDQSIQDQKASLSRLQEEQITLITRKTELESQIAENRNGMSETQRDVLIDLEKSWDNLSHHAESVRAYARLKQLGGFEKGEHIPSELQHARLELRRARMQEISQGNVRTPDQRALASYESMYRGKIEAARDVISGDIEHYNRVLIDQFPGREIGDLSLSELQKLAETDITQGMRLAQHRGTDLGPNTLSDANRLQESFRSALGDVGEFERERTGFIAQQVQETQGAYDRELVSAGIQAPITQADITRLKGRIESLETLESLPSQTLFNIRTFHDVQGGEERLAELVNIRDQFDGASAGNVAELATTNNLLGDINSRIETDTSTLSTDQTRRSALANDIATRESENSRAQEWISYYTGLGRQVVGIFS